MSLNKPLDEVTLVDIEEELLSEVADYKVAIEALHKNHLDARKELRRTHQHVMKKLRLVRDYIEAKGAKGAKGAQECTADPEPAKPAGDR